ncbi:hypothetical protein P4O66_022458, partial [Electrophorus voltai]
MVRETRHLWVGNLPENVREEKIIEHFKRYGRVESVKVLPKRGSEGGVAAFVDFVDIKSAQKAHNSVNKMGDRDLRTDYNEPGTIPTAARGLDDSLSIATRGRDVSGFTRGAGASVYGPPASLHSREGRYERRLDGASESRERAYDHSAYGHHDRGSGSSFERQRHYETDYYRDLRDRALSAGVVSAGSSSASAVGASLGVPGGVGGTGGSSVTAGGSVGAATGAGSGGPVSGGVGFYGSRSRSPGRFDTTETRYEARARDAFSLASVVHRDLYRDERGRRGERTYRHSRSRSPHTSQPHAVSPQRLAGQAAGPTHSPSGSGSRSRSSSSDSVSSSTSSSSGSDSSSSSSDESPARSVQSAAVPAPSSQPLPTLDKDEPRKSFGIKVQNLPVRSTDTSLKDGLFHEFKKHGKVTSVQIHGASEERYGLVFFRQQEDQEKALSASKGKLFFGMQIDVTAWTGPETESENEFRPLDERIDEFHPKATRTLFIGNLEKTTTYHDLLNIFQRFGEIVDIDIKKVNGAPQYAFLQYCDIASVCKAIKKMDGEYLGNNRLKLGFGKSMPTTCVWLDGLASNITEQYLTRHFCRYGHVVKVVFDRLKGMALILYNNIECAQAAVKETKGWKIGGNKIKVDFANYESQMAFYRSMQASGQDIRDFYDILSERRDERRPPYHEFSTERAYYENVRTPGTYTEDPRRKYPARSREFYTEWDPYVTDYYDPRYYEEPREYRDYRDPYEQDIRKYSYMQRERDRDRERFETDRERDHGHRIRLERYNKSDKLDKERLLFEAERGSAVEKERHPEPDREASPDAAQRNSSKLLIKEKDSGKGRLDLPPCVVQLTRVKEKEGKLMDHVIIEKQRGKAAVDPVSQVELIDKEGKSKDRKYLKADPAFDVISSSVDTDRLAARKRRFEDGAGKAMEEDRKLPQMEMLKRENKNAKPEKLVILREATDPVSDDGNIEMECAKEHHSTEFESCRKQMEQNRRLQQHLQECTKSDKTKTTPSTVAEDFDHRSLVHEEMPADSLYLVADNEAKDSPKTENKAKTSLLGEEVLCRERRQETVKAEMSFPSSIVNRESIRKRLLDTAFKIEREGRLSGSLEKNKFYEFALDKTITPDTKALLERAKSLSSSREDNWSFLGYESRFPSFRNSNDKEKIEPTPRPIPSWYMKKKKIRSDSEGKLDDKKDSKPEEQERQELFASRFLHSSIFEQDSRRLRHLERKDTDPEVTMGRDNAQLASTEKPAIRKSERIDREKMKRASSPRGETTKGLSDSKNTSKSPVHTTDIEQATDISLPHGRTRQRRNVRSVYATPHEDETPQQAGKELAESSRSMRKRVMDKESVQQDVLTTPTNTRRGRPPKIRKRGDDVSPMKGEQTKISEGEDTDSKESGSSGEVMKAAEGWRSPRSQKSHDKAKDENPTQVSNIVPGAKPQIGSKREKEPKYSERKCSVDQVDENGDAVKDGLHSGDEDSTHCQDSVIKNDAEVSNIGKEESSTPNQFKEVDDLSTDEREEALSDVEPPAESEADLFARQMELERAVENISKLAVEQPPTSYKEPSPQPPAVLQPVPAEHEDETEVEKPANPASETELAAAIDSITAEDISADADGFQTLPTYTTLLPTSDSLVLPAANEVLEPETDLAIKNIIDSEPSSVLTSDLKSSEPTNVIECPPSGMPKKGGRARPKTPKKSKGRRIFVNKRTDLTADTVFESECAAVKLPESIPEDIQTANPKAATSSAAAAVVTVAAACKHDVASAVTLDTPKEAEQPAIDQPEPQESAFHSGSNSSLYVRSPEPSSEPIAPALTPPLSRLSATPARSAKVPLTTPDWRNRTVEKGVLHIPQVSVATSVSAVAVGGPTANPPIPPDTKASDVDPSSSTLRKILMEPKYVSASNSNAVPSTLLTTTLADPRMSQNEHSPVVKASLTEDRPSPITPVTPQMVPPQPPPPQTTDTLHIFKEKMGNSVISSTATSVISRIPLPFDFDDTPRISLSNRSSALSQPKQKYRLGVNENSRYHGLSVSDEGRPPSDNISSNAGSAPGLRVNTSEGVMVLSYSGQKREGPQRIVAKISQIPPASAVDIEFQQSVSKSQIKQEPLIPQPSTPKGSQTPTSQGHAGAIISSQSFNAQPVISSIKQEGPGYDKSESSYHTSPPNAPLKTFQQPSTSPQILRYNQSMLQQQHTKKASVTESVSVKVDVKQPQAFNQSPVLSSHPSSLAGGHISCAVTPNDSTSVVLGPSGQMPQYVTNVHHPEQSVIMPPHNATQSVAVGHLSQGSVRMNSPPLSGINFGIRTDSDSSPRSGPQQCSTAAQSAVIRDMLLKSHTGPPAAGQVGGANDDDVRHFHQGARRPPVPQLQSDVMVVQPEYKGMHHGGLRLDQYNRDVRILMHQQLKDHPGVVEAHQAQTPEPPIVSSSLHISPSSSKTPPVIKSPPQALRDAPKTLEMKMPCSPHSESRIISHSPGSVISPQGVQLMHPGNTGTIPEYYREIRGFHSQLPSHSVIGINMANRGITPSQGSQEGENRPKVAHISSGGPLGDPKLDISHVRHPANMDLSRVSRIQSEIASPSYTSPTAITTKSDASPSVKKGPQSLVPGQLSLPSSLSSQIRPDIKLDHTGHPSVDMVQLLKKYPIVWQGHLALKNDSAAVQLHFVSGNNVLAHRSLPPPEGGPPLRIAQRMRLEASQLEGVARRMTVESDYCLLLALPCGLDQDDVLNQTHALKTGFITYLQAKQAAGIINVPNPGSNQ